MADSSNGDREQRKRRAKTGLAMCLETACEDFRTLQMLITQELKVSLKSASGDVFAEIKAQKMAAGIQQALANSMVFNAARAFRICDQGAGLLDVDAHERKAFVNGMKHVQLIRNVTEHGYDPKDQSRKPNERPSKHLHEEQSLAIDETSLSPGGPEDIRKGPTNLWEAYQIIERFRAYAGWASLPPDYLNPPTG